MRGNYCHLWPPCLGGAIIFYDRVTVLSEVALEAIEQRAEQVRKNRDCSNSHFRLAKAASGRAKKDADALDEMCVDYTHQNPGTETANPFIGGDMDAIRIFLDSRRRGVPVSVPMMAELARSSALDLCKSPRQSLKGPTLTSGILRACGSLA